MGLIRKLAGETVLYGLGSIIPRFLNFALVPLHTAVFSPADYGVITNLFALAGVLNVVYMMGMETAYFRFANRETDERNVFRITTTVILLTSIPISVLLYFDAPHIATLLKIPDSALYIRYLAAILLIDAFVAIPFSRLRFRKKALLFAIGKITNIAVLVGLNFYFLKVNFHPEQGVLFVFLANLIANGMYLALFYKDILEFRPVIDKKLSPEVARYGFPVMITGLAGMTNEMFSRLTISYWLPDGLYPGQSSAYIQGIFGACYKLAIIMNLAIQAFRYAAEPFFFSHATDKQSGELFARVNHYFILTCCVILIGVSINLDLLKFFLGKPEYWSGLNIVPLLLLAYLLLGVYYNLTIWFKITDKTYVGTFIAIGGAIITIVANYFFIPIWGMVGSSLAAVACYLSMVTVCYFLGQRFHPIPYKVWPGLAWLAGSIALIYLVQQWEFENLWVSAFIHGMIILCFIGLIILIEVKPKHLSIRKKR